MKQIYNQQKNFRIPQYYFAFIYLSFLFSVGFAQQTTGDAHRELNKIKSELSALQNKLKKSISNFNMQMENVKNLDMQSNLLNKSLRIAKNETRRNKRIINGLNVEIDSLNHQIVSLKKAFKKQIVFAYKYQQGRELEWLLGAENFNQALVRFRYFQKISESTERVFERLKTKQSTLVTRQSDRQQKLQAQIKLTKSKQKDQRSLSAKLANKQKLVKQVSQDQKLLESAIAGKKASYKKLEGLIGTLEREKNSRVLNTQSQVAWDKIKGNFVKQKKKLNWPVNGKVIHKFGKHKNPELKTIMINKGIDIKSVKGTAVNAVFSGVISIITYMSGFGNTIIVDHNNGYYSVYAHLNEVFVKKFQVINAGTIIGTVGDSGSLEGSMLHFEIYGANKALNPLYWLKNR